MIDGKLSIYVKVILMRGTSLDCRTSWPGAEIILGIKVDTHSHTLTHLLSVRYNAASDS